MLSKTFPDSNWFQPGTIKETQVFELPCRSSTCTNNDNENDIYMYIIEYARNCDLLNKHVDSYVQLLGSSYTKAMLSSACYSAVALKVL